MFRPFSSLIVFDVLSACLCVFLFSLPGVVVFFKDFAGWSWSGQSSFIDFTDATVRNWWASRFALDKYAGSTLDLYTWNDLNEPGVFVGPEVRHPKYIRLRVSCGLLELGIRGYAGARGWMVRASQVDVTSDRLPTLPSL